MSGDVAVVNRWRAAGNDWLGQQCGRLVDVGMLTQEPYGVGEGDGAENLLVLAGCGQRTIANGPDRRYFTKFA